MQADLSRTEKVARIFAAFDSDGDGLLCKEELSNFIEGVNPYVGFTDAQLSIILEEVAVEYAAFHAKGGLTFEGLQQTYEDGIGDVDIDYETLGLDEPVALYDSAEKPTELFYTAVASAPASASAGDGHGYVPADAEGTPSQTVAELEGTPLKKAPSAGAGSAVFTMVARAGAVAGPPSRQTSGQFAAEHGMPTPPGSARSVRSAQSFPMTGPLSRESSGTFLQGAGMEGMTPTMPRIALRPAKLRAEAAAADEGTPRSARSIRSSSSPWSASRPGSGQPGSAGWGSRGALKAFPSRPGSAEDISRPQETAPQEETSDQEAQQQTRMSAQMEALVSGSDAGSSMIRQAAPNQAEAAAVTGRALPAVAAADGAAQPGASLGSAHDAPSAHFSRANADAVVIPVAAEHAPEGGTKAPRETAPAAAAVAVLSRKRPRAIDLENHSSPAPHVAAAPALLDACMQGRQLFGSDPDGNMMSSQRPRGRSTSNESFFSTAEEAEGNMEVEASASSYASSAAYSPASSAVGGSETPGVAEHAEHGTAVDAAAFGAKADSCMLSDKPDAAAIEVHAALEAGSASTKTTAAAGGQVSGAEEEQPSTQQHVTSAAASEGNLKGCSPARASSGGRLGVTGGSAAAIQQGEFAAAHSDKSPAARALNAAGEDAPRMAEAASAAATAPVSMDSAASGDQAFVEASGASPSLGKRQRVDQQVRITASTSAITTAPEAAGACAASQPSPVAATDTRAHAHGNELATAAENQAEAGRTAAVMGDCSGAAAAETADGSADAMAGAGDREHLPSPVIAAALAAGVTVRHKRGSRIRSGAAAMAAKIGAAAGANTSGAAAGHEAETGMAAEEFGQSADVKAGGTAAPTEASILGAAAAVEALTDDASANTTTSSAACSGVTDVRAASEAGTSATAGADTGMAAEVMGLGAAAGKAAGTATADEVGSTGAAAGTGKSGATAGETCRSDAAAPAVNDRSTASEAAATTLAAPDEATRMGADSADADAEAPPKSPARAAFMSAFGALAWLARGTPSRGALAAAAAEPVAARAVIPEASHPVARFGAKSSAAVPAVDIGVQAAGLASTVEALAGSVAPAPAGADLGAAGPAELSRSAEKRAASSAAADAASCRQMLKQGLLHAPDGAMPAANEAASDATHAAAGTATPSSGALAVSQVIAGGQMREPPQHAAMNNETMSPAEGAVQTEGVLLPAQLDVPMEDKAVPVEGTMLRTDASAPDQRGCAPAQHPAAKQDTMLSTKGAAAEEHAFMPARHAARMHDPTSPAAGADSASWADRSGLAPAQHAPANDNMLLKADGAAAGECAITPARHAAPIQDTASPAAAVIAGVVAAAPAQSSSVAAQHAAAKQDTILSTKGAVAEEHESMPAQHAAPIQDTTPPHAGVIAEVEASTTGRSSLVPAQHAAGTQDVILAPECASTEARASAATQHAAPIQDTSSPAAGIIPGVNASAPGWSSSVQNQQGKSTQGALVNQGGLSATQSAMQNEESQDDAPVGESAQSSTTGRSSLVPAQHAAGTQDVILAPECASTEARASAATQHAAPIQDTSSPAAGIIPGVNASAPGWSSSVQNQQGKSTQGALVNQGGLSATQSAMQNEESQDDAPVGESAQSQAPSQGSTAAAALTEATATTVPQSEAEEITASTMAAPASVHTEAFQQKFATPTAPPHMDAAGHVMTLAAEHCSSTVQGEAAVAQGAEDGPTGAKLNTTAALAQQSGLLSGTLGPGHTSATGTAAASTAAADDTTEVLRMEVTPGAQNAGTHKQVPATGGSAMGPQTATVPVTAAQAILHAEELEQQGNGTVLETPSLQAQEQAQPRTPARAAFLLAWGALARLAGGTPSDTTPAAADTSAAPIPASAEADAGITAPFSCSDKDPADSAAQPTPVAGSRGASRAAGPSQADATAAVSNGGSSGDERSADPDAVPVAQVAPGCESIGPSLEAGAMLAAPGLSGAAETRHEGCAAVLTAAAEAGTTPDSPAAVTSVESEAAAGKDVASTPAARAAYLEAQASAKAGATAAPTRESCSDPAVDAILPSSPRQAPVAAGEKQHVGLSRAEPQGEAAAAASISKAAIVGSGQELVLVDDGAASVHAEALEQLRAQIAAPNLTDTLRDCAQEAMHAGHCKAPFMSSNQEQLCEALPAIQELDASSSEGPDMSREEAMSAGHDAVCRNEYVEAPVTQSFGGESVPTSAAQARLHLNLDEEDGAGTPASVQGSPVSPARQAFLAAFGSVQGQPMSPARARFMSAFGELARLAQGMPSESASAADAAAPVAPGASAHGSGAAAIASASPTGFDDKQPSSDGPARADREGAMVKTLVCDGASAGAANDAGAVDVAAPTDTVSVSAAASADSAPGAELHGAAPSVRSAAAANARAPAATVGDSAAVATDTASARTPEDSRSSMEEAAAIDSAAPGLKSETDAAAFAAAPSTVRSHAYAASAASPEAAELGTTNNTDQAAAAAADSSTFVHLKDGSCSPDVGISSDGKAPAVAVPGSASGAAAEVMAAALEGTSMSAEALASTSLVAQSAAIPGGACISSMAASAARAGSLAALSGKETASLQAPLDKRSAWDADAGTTPVLGRVEATDMGRRAGIGANTPPRGKTPGAAVSPLESFPISAEDASTEVSPDASSVTQPAWLQTTPGGTVLRSFPIGDDLSPSASEATTAASPFPTPPPSRSGFHGTAVAAASTELDDVDAAVAARQLPTDWNAAERTINPTPSGDCASAEEAEPDLDAVLASRQLLDAMDAVCDGPVLGASKGATAIRQAAKADFDAAEELAGGNAVGCVASGAATAAQEAAGAATAEQRLLMAAAPTPVASAAASRLVETAVAAAASRNDALLGWRTAGSQEGELPGPTLTTAAGKSAAQAVSPADECASALREGAPNRSKLGESQDAMSAADVAAMWDAEQRMTEATMLSAEVAPADAESSRVEAAAMPQAASAELEAAVAAASAHNEALLGRRDTIAADARPIRPGQAAAIDPSTDPLVEPTSGQLVAAAVSNDPSTEPLREPTSDTFLAAAVAAAAACNTLVGGGRETNALGAAVAEAAVRPIHPSHAAAIDPSTEPLEGSSSGALLAAAVAAAAECNNALVGGRQETDALGTAARPIHPGHAAALDEPSRELLEGSSSGAHLAAAVAAAAACNDALVGGGREPDALGAAIAAAAARNAAVLGLPRSDRAAPPGDSPPSRHGYLPAASPKRPLSASGSGGSLTAAVPHGYVPVAAAAAASAEPSFASPKKLPGDGAHSYVPTSRPRTPPARPTAALPASRSFTAAQMEHLTLASELQHPGAQAGVEAAAAAATAAQRQPSLVPPQEILTEASAAAHRSVQSVSETEHSRHSVPVSQRSVPDSEPSLKSIDVQQQGMRQGAVKVVETGDAPASPGASGQGASCGHRDNTPDEQAVEQQMLHGINPSLLPARGGQTDAEIYQEGETEQKRLQAPAFRKSLDLLQQPESTERPRQAQTTVDLASDQPNATSAVANSRGRSSPEAIFPAVGKAEAPAADLAAKNPSLIAAAMKTAQAPTPPAGQEGATGAETTKRPPAFRDALLRLRRPGSAGALPAAASEQPPPLSEVLPVVSSTAAAAEPTDFGFEELQRAASRRAAMVGTAQSPPDLLRAIADSPAERPAPIVPAAAGHLDAASAPAVALTPGAGVAAARFAATSGSSHAADKNGGEPVSRAQSVLPTASAPRGELPVPAVPGVATQLSGDAPVPVQGHAPTGAADGAAAAWAAREVQAAAAAKANPGLLFSSGKRTAGAVNQRAEAESEEPQRRSQPAFHTAFKRLQQPSPTSSRPTSASGAAASTGMDSTSLIAAALATQQNAESSIKPSALTDGVMTSAAVSADANAADTAVAASVTEYAVETSSKALVPEAALVAAEGRLQIAQVSHSSAGSALTASASSGGVLLAPQGPRIRAMASAEEAGNGAGRRSQPAPAGADRALTGTQPSLRGTPPGTQAAAESGASKRVSAALAAPCLPQLAAACAPSAEELPADRVAVVRAEVPAAPRQARGAQAVTEQRAGPQPNQATTSAAAPYAPDLARGADIGPNLDKSHQAIARTAPHQALATAPEQAVAPGPDQEARSAGTRGLDIPRTAHRPPALAGSLSNADELASADDVVIGSVPSRHPRQKLDFGDRSATAEEPQQPHVSPEVFGRLQALRDFYTAPIDEDDDGAFKEARSAHKVAAAAQEAESVACILESVYAEVAKGDTDLAEVSPMCLSTNPLCGQEDSPLVQAELKPQPQQETPQPTSEQEELLGWFKEQMLEAQAQRRTIFSSSLAEQSAAFAKAAAERVKVLEGNARAKVASAPRLAAAKSGRKSEDSKPSRLTSKIASMLPSPKGGKVRPGRKEASRAWINPLCDDIAGDSTASSGILAAGDGLPGRRQLSSGGADLAREGAPDQAAFGSPGLLDSGSVLATQPSAQLLSSYSQVETGALLSSDLMGSTGWFNPSYGIQAADASFSSAGSANAASRVSMAGAGVIGATSAHDASSFTFPATRRSSATSAVSSLASRQPSVLARTSMAPSLDDAEAPTPEFVPAARGDIFNSALDIMATHQSVYSDDMAHTLGSDINSLVSTLPTSANLQGERSGAGDLMGTRELMTTQQMLASRFEVAPLETGPGAAGRAPAAVAAAAQLPDRPQDASDSETETPTRSRGPSHQPVPPSEEEVEEGGFDIAAEQSNAVETLAEVLSAARAVVDGAQLGADISAPMSALRARMGLLPDAADVHAAHMACGSLLASRGFYEEGVVSFRAALALRPRNARALFHLGNAQFALQAFAEAERSFKAALQEVRPGDERLVPKVHVNLGITLEADGRLLAACNHYQAASQLEPSHFRARKLLGSAQYALADLPAARDALTAALALRPDYADAHCDLGCTLCALNEVEAAKTEFKAALAIMPRHLEALFNLGNLQRQCGEFEAAIANYEGVLEISPDHWRGLLNYSVALVGIDRHDDAKRALRRAFKLSGYSGKVAEEIGQLKRLARRGEDRARLGELMDHISERTAETVMQRPAAASPPQPKKLWRPSPARGKRPSSAGQQAQGSFLDVGLLRQLEPLASLTPVALAAAASDSGASNRQGEFEPAPGAKVVSAAAAEAVLRRVMPDLAALRFQHLMRIVRNDFLRELEAESGIEGGVDLGMLLALLVAVCRGDASVRLSAAHAILDWRADSTGVTRSAAVQYTRLLRRVYVRRQRSAGAPRTSPQDGSEVLSEAQFVDLVLARDSGCPGFAGLHDEAASAAAEVA